MKKITAFLLAGIMVAAVVLAPIKTPAYLPDALKDAEIKVSDGLKAEVSTLKSEENTINEEKIVGGSTSAESYSGAASAVVETVLDETAVGREFGTELLEGVSVFADLPLSVETAIRIPEETVEKSVIFSNYTTSSAPSLSFAVTESGAPMVSYVVGGTLYEVYFPSVDLRTGEYLDLLISVDPKNMEAKVYVDSVLKETASLTSVYDSSVLEKVFCLGGDHTAENAGYFKGEMKALAVYSVTRDANDIASESKEGLMAHYDLSASELKNYIYDLSGNGYDLEKYWFETLDKPTPDYAYSFALIGDTQNLVDHDRRYGTNYTSYIYDWIVENKEAKKIEHVFGLGDITEHYGQFFACWDIAKAQIDKLNGVVPYSLVRGNHDNPSKLNEYFASSEAYTSQLEGVYEEGKINNAYRTLRVGNIDYLLIVLDYGPSDDVLNWANDAIEAHPDHRVIISTHAYIGKNGEHLDENSSTVPNTTGVDNGERNNPDMMWDKLVSKHSNIDFVFCGHISTNDIVMTQREGDNGNIVTEILVDPQQFDINNNYETGMIALLCFSEDGKDVWVEYFSTYRGQYYRPNNQFSFNTEAKTFNTWEYNETLTESKEFVFTADVDGNYSVIDKSLDVTGEWTIEYYLGDTLYREAVTLTEESYRLPEISFFDLNKDETMRVVLTKASEDGECDIAFDVALMDEYPTKTTVTTVGTEVINIADALQTTNTTAQKSASEGLITVGYVSGTEKTGKDLTVGQKNVVSKGTYSFYSGKYNESGYGLTAYPTDYTASETWKPGSVKIESKNGSMQGVIITADKSGVYTVSTSTLIKSGKGTMTLNVEYPDGKKAYSYRTATTSVKGFEVTVALSEGEKIYIYADRTTGNYDTAYFCLYEFTLTRTYEGEFTVDDPAYEHIYEYHDVEGAEWKTMRESTCCVLGTEVKRCNLCFDVMETRSKTEYASHDFTYSEWETTLLPTYKDEGEEKCVCGVYGCGYEETAPIAVASVATVSVKQEPKKLSYNIGEEFDPTGLEVLVTYSDYEHTTVITDFSETEFTYDFSVSGGSAVGFNVLGNDLSVAVMIFDPNAELIKGDVDGDGEITKDDETGIIDYVLGKLDGISASADVNGDRVIDLKDALLIRQKLAGFNVKYFD